MQAGQRAAASSAPAKGSTTFNSRGTPQAEQFLFTLGIVACSLVRSTDLFPVKSVATFAIEEAPLPPSRMSQTTFLISGFSNDPLEYRAVGSPMRCRRLCGAVRNVVSWRWTWVSPRECNPWRRRAGYAVHAHLRRQALGRAATACRCPRGMRLHGREGAAAPAGTEAAFARMSCAGCANGAGVRLFPRPCPGCDAFSDNSG